MGDHIVSPSQSSFDTRGRDPRGSRRAADALYYEARYAYPSPADTSWSSNSSTSNAKHVGERADGRSDYTGSSTSARLSSTDIPTRQQLARLQDVVTAIPLDRRYGRNGRDGRSYSYMESPYTRYQRDEPPSQCYGGDSRCGHQYGSSDRSYRDPRDPWYSSSWNMTKPDYKMPVKAAQEQDLARQPDVITLGPDGRRPSKLAISDQPDGPAINVSPPRSQNEVIPRDYVASRADYSQHFAKSSNGRSATRPILWSKGSQAPASSQPPNLPPSEPGESPQLASLGSGSLSARSASSFETGGARLLVQMQQALADAAKSLEVMQQGNEERWSESEDSLSTDGVADDEEDSWATSTGSKTYQGGNSFASWSTPNKSHKNGAESSSTGNSQAEATTVEGSISTRSAGKRSWSAKEHEHSDGEDNARKRPRRSPNSADSRRDGSSVTLQLPCLIEGCPGRNESISELIRQLAARHNFFVCPRCYERIDEEAQYQQHRKTSTCQPRCISLKCLNATEGSTMNSPAKWCHDRAETCPSDKTIPMKHRWQYLYHLRHPEKSVSDPDIQDGRPCPHGFGRPRTSRRARPPLQDMHDVERKLAEVQLQLDAHIKQQALEAKLAQKIREESENRGKRLDAIVAGLMTEMLIHQVSIPMYLHRMIQLEAPAALDSIGLTSLPGLCNGPLTPASSGKGLASHPGLMQRPGVPAASGFSATNNLQEYGQVGNFQGFDHTGNLHGYGQGGELGGYGQSNGPQGHGQEYNNPAGGTSF